MINPVTLRRRAAAHTAAPDSIRLYAWRVKKKHPDRYGQPCKIIQRITDFTVVVRFEDGLETRVHRSGIKFIPEGDPAWKHF